MCMYQEWLYLKYKAISSLCVWINVHAWLRDTECAACLCVFVKKDRVEGEREFVTSKISEERAQASARWSDSWTYQLAACMCAGVCTGNTHRRRWAFMSMFKLSVWDRLSLWSKWTKQTDSNQLKTSTRGLGRGRVPAEAKRTNNVLTHKAVSSLDETTYQKDAMLKWQWHVQDVIWEILSLHVTKMVPYCTLSTERDKTFTTKTYEDNGPKVEIQGKGQSSKVNQKDVTYGE